MKLSNLNRIRRYRFQAGRDLSKKPWQINVNNWAIQGQSVLQVCQPTSLILEYIVAQALHILTYFIRPRRNVQSISQGWRLRLFRDSFTVTTAS